MIEAYLFLAAFPVQILAMSVLYPTWFLRHIRLRAASVPTELFAQMYPGVDLGQSVERFARRYRAANTAIAALGSVLLGWLFIRMQRPDWDEGVIKALVSAYFMMQVLPLCLVAVLGVTYSKLFARPLPDGKRKAVLQRRGLFDFVSPFVLFLAVLAYFLFVAYVIYIRQHPFPGFAGLINIGAITLVYALNTFVVYRKLYGRKNPLETHELRVHAIGVAVRSGVYMCLVTVVFLSLIFTLALLDLKRWEPFALSVFFVITTLLCFNGLMAPPRKPQAGGLGPETHAW